jgi:ArsR family transcriptional regulator
MSSRQDTCDVDIIHDDIVARVRDGMLADEDFYSLSNLYKIFADKTRLRILWALACEDMCVCDIAALLGMTKSSISHQLKLLRLANIVKSDKQGKIVFYSLVDCHVKVLLENGLEHVRE